MNHHIERGHILDFDNFKILKYEPEYIVLFIISAVDNKNKNTTILGVFIIFTRKIEFFK